MKRHADAPTQCGRAPAVVEGRRSTGERAAAVCRGSLGVADRVGIFTIHSVCEHELVLEIIDAHLDVVLSVYRHQEAPARLTVSTLVFYHNRIGRLYMVPVAPMHRIVVRSILVS